MRLFKPLGTSHHEYGDGESALSLSGKLFVLTRRGGEIQNTGKCVFSERLQSPGCEVCVGTLCGFGLGAFVSSPAVADGASLREIKRGRKRLFGDWLLFQTLRSAVALEIHHLTHL